MITCTDHYSISRQLESTITEFLSSFQSFTYFQSPVFFKVCTDTPGYTPQYVLAWKDAKLVSVLMSVRQQFMLTNLSLPLLSRTVIWGGPITHPDYPEALNELLHWYQIKKPSSLLTQVRNLFDTTASQQHFSANGFHHEPHLNIVFDLSKPETELWSEVHANRRNKIKKAIKLGCQFESRHSLDDLRQCYQLLTILYRRLKLPLPDFLHFESLLKRAEPATGLRMFVVTFEGEIIACMLCVVSNRIIFDYYAASLESHQHRYPNNLLPWEIMRWGCNNGLTAFDFGGAGKPNVPYGVRDYKQKFGGQFVNFGRYQAYTVKQTAQIISIISKLKNHFK